MLEARVFTYPAKARGPIRPGAVEVGVPLRPGHYMLVPKGRQQLAEAPHPARGGHLLRAKAGVEKLPRGPGGVLTLRSYLQRRAAIAAVAYISDRVTRSALRAREDVVHEASSHSDMAPLSSIRKTFVMPATP